MRLGSHYDQVLVVTCHWMAKTAFIHQFNPARQHDTPLPFPYYDDRSLDNGESTLGGCQPARSDAFTSASDNRKVMNSCIYLTPILSWWD